MKKHIIALTISVLTLSTVNSQTFKKIFLGEDFMQYKGSFFKLDNDNSRTLHLVFFSNLKDLQMPYFDAKVLYPDAKNSLYTVKDSLSNRIFYVENIVGNDGNLYSGNYLVGGDPIFVLRDTNSKQVIYYKYSVEFEHNFPFLTSPITFDSKALCEKIVTVVDDMTNEVTIRSPIMDSRQLSPMIFYKIIDNNEVRYFLSLTGYGRNVTFGEGVIILFDDGTKMNMPTEKIDIDIDKNMDFGYYRYRAFIQLSTAEAQYLTTKKIKKFRLYVYDNSISIGFAEKFTYYVSCIMDKK